MSGAPKQVGVTDWVSKYKQWDQEYAQRAAAADKKVPLNKRAVSHWKNLETVQKVDAGLWGVAMLLGAFGMFNTAKSSVAHDDQGHAHPQWSQVGVLILQGAMTAGCAYMAGRAINIRAI